MKPQVSQCFGEVLPGYGKRVTEPGLQAGSPLRGLGHAGKQRTTATLLPEIDIVRPAKACELHQRSA